MNFLTNPWIVGIGGGIVSGFIVYGITSRFFSRRQAKEYQQKIRTANNEILYTMRPLVVEKKLPSQQTLEAILYSTARKHEVDKNHLLSISLLADDLISEVIANPFLDSKQKIDFSNTIHELKIKSEKNLLLEDHTAKTSPPTDTISPKFFSVTIGAMTATIGSISIIGGDLIATFDTFFDKDILILLVSILVPIFFILTTSLLRDIKRSKEQESFTKLRNRLVHGIDILKENKPE